MVTKNIPNFSIAQISRSGQCFRIDETGDGMYTVTAGKHHTRICQQGEQCSFYCEKQEFEEFWTDYFDLQEDYRKYTEKIDPADSYLTAAAAYGFGIRILRQDLWETIVSFLISQQNNITRIRRCIQNICEGCGQKCVSADGEVYYAFPRPEVLAALEEDDLKACNLGYRSRYVVRTARSIACGEFSLEEAKRLPYVEAKEKLMSLYGVGEKVADCICLFALHHLQAFPIDTHIRQAMERHYQKGFPDKRYRGFQGVMQQYIFYYELFGRYVF